MINAQYPTAPCPFCNYFTRVEPAIDTDGWNYTDQYVVRCPKCMMQGPRMKSKACAAFEWNRLFEAPTIPDRPQPHTITVQTG